MKCPNKPLNDFYTCFMDYVSPRESIVVSKDIRSRGLKIRSRETCCCGILLRLDRFIHVNLVSNLGEGE